MSIFREFWEEISWRTKKSVLAHSVLKILETNVLLILSPKLVVLPNKRWYHGVAHPEGSSGEGVANSWVKIVSVVRAVALGERKEAKLEHKVVTQKHCQKKTRHEHQAKKTLNWKNEHTWQILVVDNVLPLSYQ